MIRKRSCIWKGGVKMTMEKTAKIWAGAALAAAVVMIAATFSIVFGQSGREKGGRVFGEIGRAHV